ncbi:MAG: oligopeptidase B, partial [Glaciecola sp.]
MTELLPPHADARPSTRTLHGVQWSDDFAWLRDDNWQQVMRDPSVLRDDIRGYLEAENAWTSQTMAPTAALRET